MKFPVQCLKIRTNSKEKMAKIVLVFHLAQPSIQCVVKQELKNSLPNLL